MLRGMNRFVGVIVLCLMACGGGRRATGGGGTYVAGTTLTPDPPPICGDFGRPYIAPESVGMTNPAQPPPGLGTLNALQSRIAREGDSFALYAEADQELIRNGRARVGLDERAAYLAHGLPAFYWNVQIDEQPCRVMLYSVLGEPKIDTTIYTCNGLIANIAPATPQLPCWRVSEFAPRAIEHAPHFDGAGVEREWEIMYGLLARGQTTDDVYIMFGEAYRTGMEAREDGTNASQHVYLDSTGDAYGSYLTFVDRTLVGWRFPPDRQLTAEAQQRRLDAMEQRMMDQMREMEQRSIQRHEEEMAHLNTIQQNQQQIRQDIASAREDIIGNVMQQGQMTRSTVRQQGGQTRSLINGGGGGGGGGGSVGGGGGGGGSVGGGGGQRQVPSGCQTFTFNGTRFSDRHGTPMGQPCGNGCPNGYVCLGNINRCMPSNPNERCP